MNNAITVLAGATGNLGGRIVRAVLEGGGTVRAVVRHNSNPDKVEVLRKQGVAIAAVDFNSVSEVTGKKFRLLRAGGLRRLATLIKVTRAVLPKSSALYPPWQGMQYMHNMFSGRAKLAPLDNDRYPGMRWTTVRDALTASLSEHRRNGVKPW